MKNSHIFIIGIIAAVAIYFYWQNKQTSSDNSILQSLLAPDPNGLTAQTDATWVNATPSPLWPDASFYA